jgi:Ca2+-binding RTX toxin-like protein
VIEQLELRRLMSVDLTAKGTLVVKGTTAGDAIVVSVNPKNGVVTVSVNDERDVSFAGKAVKRLWVEGDAGFDKIHVDPSLNRASTVLGGAGGDIIEGNSAAQLIGGGGNDKLVIQPFVFNFRGRTLGDAGTVWVQSGQLVLDTAGGGYLLSGGDGNDTLVGAAGSGHDSVAGGAGTDTFMASSGTLGMTASATDPLVVDGFDEFTSIERIQANANA